MRIGIDARCLEEKEISGVGEYVLEVIKNLLKIDKENEYIIFSNSYKKISRNFDYFIEYPNITIKRFRYPNKILNFFLWYFGYPKINRLIGDADVFFIPNINFLAVDKLCSFLVTFHDLSFERFPEFFTLKTRLWHKLFIEPKKITRKAKKTIAISKSTQKDLEDIYGMPEKQLEVIYHGVGEEYKIINSRDEKLAEIRGKYNLPENFIFYLGAIEPRKNILNLIRAYLKLKKDYPANGDYKLVLSGELNPLYENIKKEIQGNQFEKDIIFTGYVAKEDKPYIYNLAKLFVYPSHFEGFGLPLLEAMACGVPVITSHNSSMPEVVSNSAILVNPLRPEELGQAMKTMLTDKMLYSHFRAKGLNMAKKFSWKKCAKETLELISKIKKKK